MFGPKSDDVFLGAFRQHASKSVEAAKILLEMLEHPDQREKLALEISEREDAGDRITHDTVRRLHETWITPLDRFDIHSLISKLDDVLDLIDAVSERFVLFGITTSRPRALELTRLLIKSCETLEKGMKLFANLSGKNQELLDLCAEISRLESEGDAVYRPAIAELFKNGNDPIDVMKWRDLYDTIEEALDRCEDAANIVEGVVLEYA